MQEYIHSDIGIKQLTKAINQINVPYVVTAIIVFGLDVDLPCIENELTYMELIKETGLFDEFDFISNTVPINHVRKYFKEKYVPICEDINDNINKDVFYFDQVDDKGYTPLANAIIDGNIDIVEMMVKCFGQSLNVNSLIKKSIV
jgi:hypothetical protein